MRWEKQLENLINDISDYIEDKDAMSDFADEIKSIQDNIEAKIKAKDERILNLEQELATMHEVSINLQKSRQKCIEHIDKLEDKGEDGLSLNERLQQIAENPKWDANFRDFLKAAIKGELE